MTTQYDRTPCTPGQLGSIDIKEKWRWKWKLHTSPKGTTNQVGCRRVMERGWSKRILCLRWILCMTLPPGERVARARARPPGAPSTSSQKWVQQSSPELAFESISVSQKIWRKSIISESQTALVITLSANLFSIIMSMLFCQLHNVEINEFVASRPT